MTKFKVRFGLKLRVVRKGETMMEGMVRTVGRWVGNWGWMWKKSAVEVIKRRVLKVRKMKDDEGHGLAFAYKLDVYFGEELSKEKGEDDKV